jgi:outer membrane protein assembly factor BamC
MPPPRVRQLVLACALGVLAAGCTTVQEVAEERRIDYRGQAARTAGLDVPPDLTQIGREGAAQPAPGGVVSASSMGAGAAASGAARPAVVAPIALSDFRIERQGQQRWLVTSRSPEALWEPIKAFWTERGFTLEVDNAQAGVMETGWAENRAKIPEDFIRRTIGRVFDGLYSTGERDRFRTRLERTPGGGTEIYISHRGTEEVYTGAAQERTSWQPRRSDPELEAEFLARLMVALGAPEQGARQAVAQAAERPAAATTARVPAVSAEARLEIAEGFDRAWRRVGLALDRSGFTVEDRDRAAGLYFVRYIDPASTAAQQEPGLLDRVLNRSRDPKIERYRVRVEARGSDATVVTLQNAQGGTETGPTARRILEQVAAQLR